MCGLQAGLSQSDQVALIVERYFPLLSGACRSEETHSFVNPERGSSADDSAFVLMGLGYCGRFARTLAWCRSFMVSSAAFHSYIKRRPTPARSRCKSHPLITNDKSFDRCAFFGPAHSQAMV